MGIEYLKWRPVLIVILVAAALFVFFGGQLCVVKTVWGVPCPSCGMTRAYLRLFAGDLPGAFFFHPLFLLPPLLVLGAIFIPIRSRTGRILIIITIALFIIVWIVRMILFFPHTVPMDLNRDSILFRIIGLFFR